MRIVLTGFENTSIINLGRRYKKKTGKDYSLAYITRLLAERYSERLQEDLEEILKIKLKDLDEQESTMNNRNTN